MQRQLEIRCRQGVKAASPRRVGLAGRLEDAIAVGVKSDQKLVFGSRCGLIDLDERVLLDEKGHFARMVMPPEADAATLAVVAAALIGEVNWHIISVCGDAAAKLHIS